MYEHKSQPLADRRVFLHRVFQRSTSGLMLVILALGAGMAGYHFLENLAWLDAFLNASMILSGMGPVDRPATSGGKLFAGMYAIFSGLAVILIVGYSVEPVVHRLFHRFHLEGEKHQSGRDRKP